MKRAGLKAYYGWIFEHEWSLAIEVAVDATPKVDQHWTQLKFQDPPELSLNRFDV